MNKEVNEFITADFNDPGLPLENYHIFISVSPLILKQTCSFFPLKAGAQTAKKF